jgi:hypothetical protein
MSAPLFHFPRPRNRRAVRRLRHQHAERRGAVPFVLQWEQYKRWCNAALPHIRASGIGEVRFSTR